MSHTIRALSFDADNCLFHAGYDPTWAEIHSGKCRQVVTKNQPLLNTLKAEQANFKETIVLVGSLRQSVTTDHFNAQKGTTESVFSAIQKIAEHLEATLDKFLLSDIYADVTPGTSFDLAVKTPNSTQNTCIDDAGKAALLYAQIHKLANQCPNESILFDFYDDRGLDAWGEGDDVLEYLHGFFTKHPELLPNNMTLRLNHYEGAAVTPYTDIKGTGFIDENYQQTTKDLAETSQHGCRHIAKINPSNLTNRKALALPATDTASAEEKETSFLFFQPPFLSLRTNRIAR